MFLFCYTANVDAVVHLLPHSFTHVARDGLQHRCLSCDERGTRRVFVNYRTNIHSSCIKVHIAVLSNCHTEIYVSENV